MPSPVFYLKKKIMKKILLIVLLLALTKIQAFAYGHDLYIYNNTDCDIAVVVYASCPDEDPCVEYSCLCMTGIPPHSSISYPAGSYPWSTPPPSCSDWSWYRAHVQIFCNGVFYFYDFGGNNTNTHCSVPPRDAEHIPPPDGCCAGGSNSTIKMTMTHGAAGSSVTIGY